MLWAVLDCSLFPHYRYIMTCSHRVPQDSHWPGFSLFCDLCFHISLSKATADKTEYGRCLRWEKFVMFLITWEILLSYRTAFGTVHKYERYWLLHLDSLRHNLAGGSLILLSQSSCVNLLWLRMTWACYFKFPNCAFHLTPTHVHFPSVCPTHHRQNFLCRAQIIVTS